MLQLPDWEASGFSGAPEDQKSIGGEQLMRAFSKVRTFDAAGNSYGSRYLSNCFFVFRADLAEGRPLLVSRDRALKTSAVELEANLNAGLWNNTYQFIQIWEMPGGVRYKIGNVGQEIRTIETIRSVGRSEETVIGAMMPSPISASDMLQVVLYDQDDLSRLKPQGQPISVPGAWQWLGSRSPSWH